MFVLNTIGGYSQSQSFKRYSVEEGLSYAKVNSIYQDSKGYIWSGGSGGLCKFDGYSFYSYQQKDGLSNNYVTSLVEGEIGVLYIGTLNGISVLKDEGIESFENNADLPSLNINCLYSNSSTLYIGTEKGLSVYSNSRVLNSKEKYRIHDVLKTRFGVLVASDHGLFKLDGDRLKPFEYFQDSLRVNALYEDESALYIGTKKGLVIVSNTNKVRYIGSKEGLIGADVVDVTSKDDGQIWVGTGFALQKFDGKRFEPVFVNNHPYSNSIRTLFRDYEGLLWVGSSYGIYKSVGSVFRHYSFKDGFLGRYIYQITRDENGDLWIATDERGAYKYLNNRFEVTNKFFGLSDNSVKSILSFNEKLFFGTNNGLNIKDENGFRVLDKKDGLVSDQVYSLINDQLGNVWIGGRGGVSVYDGSFVKSYKSSFSELAQLWALKEDRDNTIWAGAYQGGVYKLIDGEFVSLNDSLGIKDDNCLAIHEDYKGNLWFATYDGVYLYEKQDKKLTNIGTKKGLSSNLVYSFVEEKTHPYLWVGTNQGVNRIDLEEFYKERKVNVVQYGYDDGFYGVECNPNATYLDTNGGIWFGTVNGLIRYNPDKRNENSIPSKTHITGVKIFYQDTLLEDGQLLPYESNHLTFSYEGICHSNPGKVSYRFRLLGFRDEWSPISKARETTYSNLPPGDYTFQVISSNNEGVWNEKAEEFRFSIERPFYLKWWFYVVFITGVVVVVYSVFKFRLNRLEVKKDLERRMDNLKLQALRSQMNPHFIFNSLNSIQHYINNNEKREANLYLSKFAQLMRNILDNSRKPLVTINNDLKGVELYMQLEQMRFEGRFDYKIEMDDEIDPYEDEVPPMLLQPFVENSIIHGFKGLERIGVISLSIGLVDGYVKYQISDNGIGREAAEKNKKKKVSKLHESAAMSITKSRIDTLGQYYKDDLKIEIHDLKTEKGNPLGTSVTILIPHDYNPKNRLL